MMTDRTKGSKIGRNGVPLKITHHSKSVKKWGWREGERGRQGERWDRGKEGNGGKGGRRQRERQGGGGEGRRREKGEKGEWRREGVIEEEV